jgi:photosystem II stability/assembly factor-like uncharacterized protein
MHDRKDNRRALLGGILATASILTLASAAPAAPRWQPLPPFGGPVAALAASPSSAVPLYAGTETGGALRSDDGGATWTPADDTDLVPLRIVKLVSDPHDRSVLFAVAQRRFVDEDGLVLRSTDAGAHWSRLSLSSSSTPPPVGDLAADPFAPGTFYAATGQGIFRSRDSGQSWQQIGPADLQALAVAADPFHPGVLFAAVYQPAAAVLVSTDGGAHWEARTQGIERPSAFRVIFFDPRTPDTVFVAGNGWPTYRSRDRGATWTKIDRPLVSLAAGPGLTLFGAPYSELTGEQGVLRSTDGGLTWSRTGALPDRVFQVLTADGRLYAGGTLGVWVSGNGGTTWQPSSQGLSARTLRDLTVTGTAIYMTALDGALVSADGSHWRRLRDTAEPTPPLVRFLTAAPNAIYASSDPRGGSVIARSTDGGITWMRIDPDLGGIFPTVAVDPRHPDTLYAGSIELSGSDQGRCHLAKSLDAGRTWTCLTTEAGVASMIVEPSTSILYMNGSSAYVNGRIEGRYYGLPPDGAEAFTLDPQRPGTLYDATSQGVYKTVDGGLHWKRSSRGIPGAVHSVALDPRQTATVYAGGAGQVYRSLNGGGSWQPVGTGLPAGVSITWLAVDPKHPSRLYAVADGRGLYRLDLNAP